MMLLSIAVFAQTSEIYVVVSGNTATFYYDTKKSEHTEGHILAPQIWEDQDWKPIRETIKTVVFDKSFQDCEPERCTYWFMNFKNLTEIKGMKEYLKTDKVTSMYYMFLSCKSLTTLDISSFNTKNVYDMGGMFEWCDNLKTIYVGSGWNTNKLTSNGEKYMFDGCDRLHGTKGSSPYNLKEYGKKYARIDGGESAPGYFSNVGDPVFDARELYVVINKGEATYYFNDLKPDGALAVQSSLNDKNWADKYTSITSVKIDKSMKEYNPKSCAYWFSNFKNVKTISGLSNLQTATVTDMSYMFYNCESLQSVDLNGLESFAVTKMDGMFGGCKSLRTIFVSNAWRTTAVKSSKDMFADCNNLYGVYGSTPKKLKVYDATYAKIDKGSDDPGYLSKTGDPVWDPMEIYVVIENGTATFYYNDSKPEEALPVRSSAIDAGWTSEVLESIKTVVFDKSFNNYRPTSTNHWFYGFKNLTEISGMTENLHTTTVTDMSYMFYGCESLKTLDFSRLSVYSVTNMDCMFYNCNSLRTIYESSNWHLESLKSSSDMFALCDQLYGGKGTSPVNMEVYDATYTRIDNGPYSKGYFTKVGEAAYEPPVTYAVFDSKTGTITFGYSKTLPEGAVEFRVKNASETWFAADVAKAADIKKVVFDNSFADYSPKLCYYWFYQCSNLTEIEGLSNLNTKRVISMRSMFNGCNKLANIDLSGFNTEKVTDMHQMFRGCRSVSVLDLRNFNTAKVENMADMFFSCSELKTILVSDKFSTENVTYSDGMFRFCSNLEGNKGTILDDEIIDKTYAIIDGGKDNPGYFSELTALSMEITGDIKTEYTVGESFSLINGSITVKYNNNTTQTVDLSRARITGYDKTQIGEQTVKIVYEGLVTELKVTVKEKEKENPPTPVSSTPDTQSDIKVWSSNSTIFIESTPDTKYTIIDLNGRTIKSATTKSTKEEIRIDKSGVYVIIINNRSFKLSL